MRTMLKSKIHRARVTDVNVAYEGSITIDKNLMEAADMIPYERVEVLNVNNGSRFSTYCIEGVAGSGQICINGAAARLAARDDIVIILTYHDLPEEDARRASPSLVYVNSQNKITSTGHRVESVNNFISSVEA
jgi:aspartate 1-decarboxylase